ncbi:MAG: DNA gyrase inhibitor YacG [Betaproteobacteria bacterium]|nr:DNA gyrase inhibitor YacG [Betaproteobacteria bacterium]
MASPLRIVVCPRCKAAVEWRPENRWRPFCSERCKTNDLGAWATEKFRVAADEQDADDLPDSRPE